MSQGSALLKSGWSGSMSINRIKDSSKVLAPNIKSGLCWSGGLMLSVVVRYKLRKNQKNRVVSMLASTGSRMLLTCLQALESKKTYCKGTVVTTQSKRGDCSALFVKP